MSIFVKAHKRSGAIIQAYYRKGSTIKAAKQLGRIANAIKRKAGAPGWGPISPYKPGAQKAYRAFRRAEQIARAHRDAKREIGNALLGRSTETVNGRKMTRNRTGSPSTFEDAFKPGYASSTLIGPKTPMPGFRASTATTFQGRHRYGQNIVIGGPFSAHPRGTRIDVRAIVDPWERYHRKQKPRRRRRSR